MTNTPDAASAEDVDPRAITVSGAFLADIAAIAQTEMTLLMAIGAIGEQKVLVPLVDFAMRAPAKAAEGPAAEPRPAYSGVLTFENAGYVIFDLARDYAAVCSQLVSAAQGGLKPDPVRMEALDRYLAQAEAEIRACREHLALLAPADTRG